MEDQFWEIDRLEKGESRCKKCNERLSTHNEEGLCDYCFNEECSSELY